MNGIVGLISQQLNHRNYIGYKSIVIKEVTRFTRIWLQTLIAPMMTLSLYFLVFGQVIGTRIGGIHGFTYIQYIAPGLIMIAIITNSFTNISSSLFIARTTRNIEEIFVSPIPNILILLGYATGSIARGLLVGFIVTIVALCFTHFTFNHIAVMVLSVILSSMLFSLVGFACASIANKYDQVAMVPTFVLTPLIYLGGVFYSIDNLTPLWQKISLLNPLLYIINTFRYGLLGISDINITKSIIMMILFILIFLCLNLSLLKRGIGKTL